MACLYLPFFDVSQLSLGTITITRTTFDPVVVTLNAITYDDANSDQSSIFQLSTFSDVAGNDPDYSTRFPTFAAASYYAALTQALTPLLIAEWSGDHQDFNIVLDNSTGKVTFSALVNFGVSWSTAAGRAMFGFQGNISQTASSYTGTYTPNYCIDCTLDAPSRLSALYEPDGLGSHAIADDGQGSMMARSSAPLYFDWYQEFESKFKTYRIGVAHGGGIGEDPSHPFSFQELFEHCRNGFPFLLRATGFTGKCFSFRTDGMSFHPERAGEGNDAQFHIPFRCVDHGFAS
jgi:hypothetical protein